MALIADIKMMETAMREIGFDPNKMPLGKLKKTTVMQGYRVLQELSTLIVGASAISGGGGGSGGVSDPNAGGGGASSGGSGGSGGGGPSGANKQRIMVQPRATLKAIPLSAALPLTPRPSPSPSRSSRMSSTRSSLIPPMAHRARARSSR